jgi:hypothetical protein
VNSVTTRFEPWHRVTICRISGGKTSSAPQLDPDSVTRKLHNQERKGGETTDSYTHRLAVRCLTLIDPLIVQQRSWY